jgi:hypothetical protein
MSVGSDDCPGNALPTYVRDDSLRSQPASAYSHNAKKPRRGQPCRSKTVSTTPRMRSNPLSPGTGEISGLARGKQSSIWIATALRASR